jgi:lysophospholipid acyltransferase (LPLAT)-like uncharacterized protein
MHRSGSGVSVGYQQEGCNLPKGFRTFARVGVWFYKRYIGTLRVVWLKESGEPLEDCLPKGAVLAGWHHHQFLVPGLLGPKGVYFVVSRSMGAELLKTAARVFGSDFVQGVRGIEGPKTTVRLLRLLKEGNSVAIAPDGPRGPRCLAKPGPAYLALRLGVPVIPVAMASSLKIHNPFSWPRYWIPLPFARLVVVVGKPLFPIQAQGPLKVRIEHGRCCIQDTLSRLDRLALAFLKSSPQQCKV